MDAKFFPGRLRELREGRGLTRLGLAIRLGVKQSAVSNWELGYREPNYATLIALCATFGLTPNDLFTQPRSVSAKRGRGRPKQGESAQPSGGTDTKRRSKSKRGSTGS
jgi:transcriptional regulator with XRE-family HTH domain